MTQGKIQSLFATIINNQLHKLSKHWIYEMEKGRVEGVELTQTDAQ